MPKLTLAFVADVKQAVSGIDQVNSKMGSFGSTMKAGAGLIGSYLALDKIKSWGEEWINASRNAHKAATNVKVVYGDAAKTVTDWAAHSAATLGISTAKADQYAASFGQAMRAYGLTGETAAKQSTAVIQRAAELAKTTGTSVDGVLGNIESALKGRTAPLAQLGVHLDMAGIKAKLAAGGVTDFASEAGQAALATEILNQFMAGTSDVAGRITPGGMPELRASVDDLKASLGDALLPIVDPVVKGLNAVTDWAKEHPTTFKIITFTVLGLATAFGIASVAGLIFNIVMSPITIPVLAVVAAIAALVAIIVVCVKYWSTIVGWLRTAWQWFSNLPGPILAIVAVLGGPFAATAVIISQWGRIWSAISGPIHAVAGAIGAVVGAISAAIGWFERLASAAASVLNPINAVKGAIQGLEGLASKVGGVIGKLNPFGHMVAPPPAALSVPGALGPSSYGSTLGVGMPGAMTVNVNVNGDVGDPVILARRMVAALEAYANTSGRGRLAALVGI